ncbi:MAG: SRPBCC domain-containing protein [Pseudomonadota bacterium]
MDAIFKALADPTRRQLLDRLRQMDGQTLSDLEATSELSRFGIMKHLGILEDAGLITTKKVGRFKHHYLNALPLQEAIDRWIDPFITKPAARAVLDLKLELERTAQMTEKPDFVMSTYIDATHDALWDALTKGDLIAKYHFICSQVEGDYVAGGTVEYKFPDGSAMLSNRIIRVDPKSLIEMSFQPHWDETATESRCVYLVEASGSQMRLTVEHYNLGPGSDGIADGWVRFLSGLKTYLETGNTIRFSMPEDAQ